MLMAALKEPVKAVTTRPPTGNGSKPVIGRGVKHRKLSRQGRIALAADIATGSRPYVPSLAQTCSALDISIAAVRAEIKARAAAANGNGGTKPLAIMAAELVNQLGLDGAFDLLVEAAER